MVFWKTYPLFRVMETCWNQDVFRPQLIEKEHVHSPAGPMIQVTTPEEVEEMRLFLRTYFGSEDKPIFDISTENLCGEEDVLFAVHDEGTLIGCIRYHYMGILSERMYCVDCFCIHPEWRGKGVGDYLLTELHHYVNVNQIPYSFFLKEGALLSIFHPPLYSGMYMYRELSTRYTSMYLTDLTISEAYRLMDCYMDVHPKVLLIRNEKNPNQIWKWFRKGLDSILVCVQDSHQRMRVPHGTGARMGWVTAWLESSMVTDEIRAEASTALAHSLFPRFGYLWINKEWTGNDKGWTMDGAFHWYTYQWTTSLSMHPSYAIIS